MKRGVLNNSIVSVMLLSASITALADEALPKRTLKSNYVEVYNQKPKVVDNFSDMFKEGDFYGRLRSNTYFLNWEKENATQKNYVASGLGGSLIYQSAIYNDFDFKTGLYYSRGFVSLPDSEIARLKSAKDVFSRFDKINSDSNDIAVLGQAYLRYSGIEKSEIKVGRQLVETFFTKSNDIAMIPNTFDAAVFSTKALQKTSLTLAYITEQKTRGQSEANSVLMYGDSAYSSSLSPAWSTNDDNAMHRGLTYSALKASGKPTDAPLIVFDAKNSSIENLQIDTAYYSVPQLLSEAMVEGNYKVKLSQDFSITPGIRYIKQFDDGAGGVGGAAIDATPSGYKDPSSLDSQMAMARLVAQYKNYKVRVAYSQVMDEADLVSPWRGFLTSGYTFSLTRIDWLANQRSAQIELMINANTTGIYKDLYMRFYATHIDSDENKGHFDENYYYAGFIQNIPSMQNLQWRLRIGYLDTEKPDADTLDTRIELNYLF